MEYRTPALQSATGGLRQVQNTLGIRVSESAIFALTPSLLHPHEHTHECSLRRSRSEKMTLRLQLIGRERSTHD
mgnify:CR=1 FL=1